MDCVNCKSPKCNMHNVAIGKYCDNVLNACIEASKCLPNTGERNVKGNATVAGWSDYCEGARRLSLEWHHIWKGQGKPHTGYTAYMMRKSRLEYHKTVKFVKRKESVIRSEKMAQCLVQNNGRDFWKEVKLVKGKNCKKLPKSVDGIIGNECIAQLFAEKFSSVFNSVGYDLEECNSLIAECNRLSYQMSKHEVDVFLITIDDLVKVVYKLKSGKSDGHFGLFSDHIIHGSMSLFKHLVTLFNCMFIHGISPQIMLDGTTVPIPKSRKIYVSDNFRGICLQSVLCKIMDIFILNKEQDKFKTSDLQFGFKNNHSTCMANSVVSETIDYYINKGGEVYKLALDASKAFDKVNIVKLFKIMSKRKLNPLYMRLLINMYVNQRIRVRFNNSVSNYFTVTNGVKQGGVLSPVLFTCYINDLLEDVSNTGYGCYIGNHFTGCVAYADDIVLLSPSYTALNFMIKKVENFAKEFDITFNGNKSKLMYFSKKCSNQKVNVKVNNVSVEQVSSITYLGHKIFTDRTNPLVEGVVKDFNCKVNSVISDFSGISSFVKHKLYEKYCTSFYGSNFIDYSSCAIDTLCKQWRKAMRRILHVNPRTHSRFLPHIVDTPPVHVTLMQRFVKFFYSGIRSKNNIVNFIFENALFSRSRLGSNIKYILLSYCNVKPALNHNVNYLCKSIYDSWLSSCSEEDIRISGQINELISHRDCIVPNGFNLEDTNDIIEFLCIS